MLLLCLAAWILGRRREYAWSAALILAEGLRLLLLTSASQTPATASIAAAGLAASHALALLIARQVLPVTRTLPRMAALCLANIYLMVLAALLLGATGGAMAWLIMPLIVWCGLLDVLLAGIGIAYLVALPRAHQASASQPSRHAYGVALTVAYAISAYALFNQAAHASAATLSMAGLESAWTIQIALLAVCARVLLVPAALVLQPVAPSADLLSSRQGPSALPAATLGPGTPASALADAHEQIESRLAALTETVEKQRQMNSLMSHELRAPVATISAATQSLEMVLAGSGEQVDSRLQRIGRAVTRITELMDQLLNQESIYDQALVPDRCLVDLAGLAREVAASLQRDAAHKLVILAPAETPAWCDGPLTGVVLRNLMHNAIKYSPADQPIEIEVGTRPGTSGNIAWIRVTDHGPGIERDNQSRIFDPHFRQSEHRETKGLGIGLYLVRKICERQDGTLTVESEPGNGARFTIALPTDAT